MANGSFFVRVEMADLGIYWKAADGTGEDEKLGSAPDRTHVAHGLGPAMEKLWCCMETVSRMLCRYRNAVDGRRPCKKAAAAGKVYMRLSRRFHLMGDGWHMSSDESGKSEIYVRPFPDVNKGKWQVSTNGGDSPLWSPDGRELFYRSDEDAVMAVAVETEPTFKLGNAKSSFSRNYVPGLSDTFGHSMGHQPGRQAVPDDKATASTAAAPHGSRPTQNQHRPELV